MRRAGTIVGLFLGTALLLTPACTKSESEESAKRTAPGPVMARAEVRPGPSPVEYEPVAPYELTATPTSTTDTELPDNGHVHQLPEDAVVLVYRAFKDALERGDMEDALAVVAEPLDPVRSRRLAEEMTKLSNATRAGVVALQPASDARLQGHWAIIVADTHVTRNNTTQAVPHPHYFVQTDDGWRLVPDGIRSDPAIREVMDADHDTLRTWFRDLGATARPATPTETDTAITTTPPTITDHHPTGETTPIVEPTASWPDPVVETTEPTPTPGGSRGTPITEPAPIEVEPIVVEPIEPTPPAIITPREPIVIAEPEPPIVIDEPVTPGVIDPEPVVINEPVTPRVVEPVTPVEITPPVVPVVIEEPLPQIDVPLEEKELLDGAMTMLIPEAFIEMPEEMLRAKYPMNQRPTEVYTNEAGSVNVALNLTSNRVAAHELPAVHKTMESQFRRLYPDANWANSELTEISGHTFMVLELTTPAVDTHVHNIIVGTSWSGRLLLVSFNTTIDEAHEWYPVGEHIIDSITLHPPVD